MNDKPLILIIDDDPQIRELTAKLLEGNGFSTVTAGRTADADPILAGRRVDLILLDIMMPNEDGRQFCQRVRQTSKIPIIMLTALRDDIDRIVGLEIGADDYVTKPFTPLELVARIKAVLRRAPMTLPGEAQQRHRRYVFGDFMLDVDLRQLRRHDETEIDLTTGEFALLLALIEARPRVLSRDQLLDLTRGAASNPFDRSIDTHISRLRKKIEPDPRKTKFIKTVRNLGYAFAGKIDAKSNGAPS